MIDATTDLQLREAAFAWLKERTADGRVGLRYDDVKDFTFAGRRVPLLDYTRGIRKPAHMNAALSFRTVYRPDGAVRPYDDEVGADGYMRYKYRRDELGDRENESLRRAMEDGLPLIWFLGVQQGLYVPIYPVWLVDDEPEHEQFVVALDATLRNAAAERVGSVPLQRSYAERLYRLRLHQPRFRAQVLHAYDTSCAVCRLRFVQLLDAAHILADVHPRGLPVVSNGLALCKIHHAAFDANILGIRPDLVVEIRQDVLEASDGPMLRHGLQAMSGSTISVPVRRADRPDRDALEERYAIFRAA